MGISQREKVEVALGGDRVGLSVAEKPGSGFGIDGAPC